MAMSPASSPRLPSPPPMAEDQLGPKSPAATTFSNFQRSLGLSPLDKFDPIDTDASRRIRPGTKSADMPEGPPLVDISEIESAYQLTEHLKALYHDAIHPKDTDTTVPINSETAIRIATAPKDVDRNLWLYELCRFLTQKVNAIIIALFADTPPCSAQTCSEMRASEWQYLCAVHDPPKACCAIDYCCHTIDWAASTLTSQKSFPSRMALGTEQPSHAQMRMLTNIFRRAYRIFAHAWFQHREVFWKVENQTGLYILFKAVCEQYNLIPEDGYTVPPEAEGKAPREISDHPTIPIILSPGSVEQQSVSPGPSTKDVSTTTREKQDLESSSLSAVNTTKRHRSTPSADLGAILDVLDEKEEEDPAAESRKQSVIKTTEAPTVEPSKTTITSTAPVTEEANVEVPEPVSIPAEPSDPIDDSVPEQDHAHSETTQVEPISVVEDSTSVTSEPPEMITPLEFPDAPEDLSPTEMKEEAPIELKEELVLRPKVEEVAKPDDEADTSKVAVEETPVPAEKDEIPTEEKTK